MKKMSKNFPKEKQKAPRVLEYLWYLLVLSLTLLIVLPQPTQAFVALFTDEAMIVSQASYPGSCVDLSEWTTSAGSCDNVICYVEPSGNYTVTRSCRPREDYENPDTDNCQWVSNTTLTFPDCCPILDCAEATPISAANASACLDIASDFACSVWKNLTSGCSDTSSSVYNITQIYCNNTCGYC